MIRHVIQPVSHGKRARLWSARVRLDGWPKARTYPLRVTDKRVAQQKMETLVRELEKEAAGIIAPKLMRDAAQTPISEHLTAFLVDLRVKGRSVATLGKYRNCISKLCERCRWVMVRDITAQSFCDWRARSGLRPKMLNNVFGAMCSLLHWMEQQQLLVANPLRHVQKVTNNAGPFRRALSPVSAQSLLDAVPFHRATVYLMVLYTGLRRSELNGLKWEDFELEASPPKMQVPSSISKNRKASVHYLRPEAVSALRDYRSIDAKPSDYAFRGRVPRPSTVRNDLERAKIPLVDEHGRRVDLHALRTTFGTMLAANGVSLQSSKSLMRHSDVKLTLKVYTDESHLPLQHALDTLPSFTVPKPAAQLTALSGVVLSVKQSETVAEGRNGERLQNSDRVAVSRENAAGVVSSGRGKLVGPGRFELPIAFRVKTGMRSPLKDAV